MSASELQDEEIEVLGSIYEGDTLYTEVDPKKHQYKFGEDGSSKSFILELSWGSEYPEAIPEISLDSFYNKHLVSEVREAITEAVKSEAEQYLGMSMTYTLFEYVKENLGTLLEKQPDSIEAVHNLAEDVSEMSCRDDRKKDTSPKKEQLTKTQKRRMWDKGGLDGEDRPRGWDWVDVIRHLSQTGPSQDS